MRDEAFDRVPTDEPDSLRPRPERDFPVRGLDPRGSEPVSLIGRRARAFGTASQGLLHVSIDGDAYSLESSGDSRVAPDTPADVVEVGVDRLFRQWANSYEELWVVPISFPFVVCRWRHGTESGGRLIWNSPDDAGAASRLRRIAESWTALDRSWKRDVSESAKLEGSAGLESRWAWSRAALLSAVRSGPDRDAVQAESDRPLSPTEVGWIALSLSCAGRSDLSTDVVRRITDLRVRSHVTAWVNRWVGREGRQPDEEAEAFPQFLDLPGRTDAPLHGRPGDSPPDVLEAAAFCGRFVDRGLGVRPDSRFGRVRFGPSEAVLPLDADGMVRLNDLCVGRAQRPFHMSFAWGATAPSGHERIHTFEAAPGSGATPLQVVFEPLLDLQSIDSVTLDGHPVEPEISDRTANGIRVRLQCPLDGLRALQIRGTRP